MDGVPKAGVVDGVPKAGVVDGVPNIIGLVYKHNKHDNILF